MIYLDNASTTKPLYPPGTSVFANPSSRTHLLGIEARNLVEDARERIKELFDLPDSWVCFTSGATESIQILSRRLSGHGIESLTHDINHSAVLGVAKSKYHRTNAESCFFHHRVNNETGMLFDLTEAKDYKFSVNDASQAIAKVSSPAVFGDFIVGSPHKWHGALGLGLIAIRNLEHLELLQDSYSRDSQEKGIRPGTLNTPAIIQTGEVAKWMLKNGEEYRAKLKHLQSTFENKIRSLTDCWIIGVDKERAPHITSLNLPGVDNEALIAAVNDRLAIASGSACTSEKVEPSHVLMAMFNDREIADTTVRISYGWFNTEAEVLEAAEIIAKAAETIRSFSL